MKPKEYSNVVRFQKSLWLMQNGNRDFADIAYLSCSVMHESTCQSMNATIGNRKVL